LTENENKAQDIKIPLLRAMARLGLGIVVLFVVFIAVINLSPVQSALIKQVTSYIAEKAGHSSSVEEVRIRWFDTMELIGLNIYDKQNRIMAEADRIKLDFSLFHLLDNQSINIDKAVLDQARVTMMRNAPENEFNFTYFIDRIRDEFTPDRPRSKARKLLITEVELNNSSFLLDNTGRDSTRYSFDHNHFVLKDLRGTLENFTVLPGNIFFEAKKLHCYDSATNLAIEQLDVNYRYTRQSMIFQQMHLVIGNSVIDNSMIFNYDSPKDLSNFVEDVKITSNFKSSLINIHDLGYFVPKLQKYKEYFRLRGYFEGEVSRFNTNNVILEFGKSSRIEGYFNMYGLPNFSETFINANVSQASINVPDLSPYVKKQDIDQIRKFGRVNFDGRFSGFPYDFVADGFFITDIGNFDSDINLKINQQDRDASTYSGRMATHNLNLGLLFEDTTNFQQVSFEGKLDGTGFTRESADIDLVAAIHKLGYKGYNYQNIQTDAHLTNELFEGNLTIDDPNLKFNGNMTIDYTEGKDIVSARAQLDSANLHILKLTENETFVRTNLDVNIQGLQSDQLLGNARFKDMFIRYEDRELSLARFEFISEQDSLGRTFDVKSSLLDARIFGDFLLAEFGKDLGVLLHEYWLNIKNDHDKLAQYYKEKKIDPGAYYYLDYEVNLKDINPFIQLFEPEMAFSENGLITGSFTGGLTNVLEINADIKNIEYDQKRFKDNTFQLTTSNYADTSKIDATARIRSSRQYSNNRVKSKNLLVDLDWHEHNIDFSAAIEQFDAENYVKLSGEVRLLPEKTTVRFKPSELKAVGKIWNFSSDNLIELKSHHYEVHNLALYNESQRISLQGVVSENATEQLYLDVKNFDINSISPIVGKDLEGTVNGFVELKDYFNQRIINSNINIRSLFLEGFEIGDIQSHYTYLAEHKHFETELSLTYKQRKTLHLTGFINPYHKSDQLNLQAEFENANLNILEPFYQNILSDLRGEVYGSFDITGRLTAPLINGTGFVEQGNVLLDYQNTKYTFNGDVAFDNNKITFSEVSIFDEEGSEGNLSGSIRHDNFRNMRYNFNGTFSNFQVLNTTAAMNDLFYGTAYATGNIRIYGRGKNVNFKGRAASNRNTRIFIPLDEGYEVAQEDFIQFVVPKDTLQDPDIAELDQQQRAANAVLNFDFDLDVNTNAYIEIIFDRTAGDIIRGRGNGNLKMLASTDGDFEMYGDYEIEEGGYNFTMYNIINKEFSILPGSTITWNGDPYGATLDIDATYRQLASLIPILNVPLDDNDRGPELSRKYPAYVELFINGDLNAPDIDFDIMIEDYPENVTVNGVSLNSYVTAFYNRLRNNEQEMKKQVFSLIVLKNFSPEDAFNVSGRTLGNSVSELISNQLSYWISQVDENLVIDFDLDLSTMSDDAFNTFQMRLSYSFLDGRLKVTRDGSFSSDPVYNSTASLIGDWTVEYLLTEDGKLRAKVYNKTNYNNLTGNFNNRTSTSPGFSLIHTQSFDEIFKKIRENSQKEKEDEDKKEEQPADEQPPKEAITKEERYTPEQEIE